MAGYALWLYLNLLGKYFMIRYVTVATFVLFGFMEALLASTAKAAEPVSGCGAGLFSVVASVTRIKPANLPVKVQINQNAPAEDRKVGTCLKAGEILSLTQANQEVELFIKGKFVLVTSGPPFNGMYMIPHGWAAASDAAAAWVAGLSDLPSAIGVPPHKPTATAISRGEPIDEKSQGTTSWQPLRHIQTLRNLPKQQIVANANVILSWRNGEGPWLCQGLSTDRANVGEAQSMSSGWCAFRLTDRDTARLAVKDRRGDQIGWNVLVVSHADVPRPEWIKGSDDTITIPDRAAWAVWVWQASGPQWRLQSMSMLNEIAEESWLAGYVLNSILVDAPLVPASQARIQ
jgi:hypothetical protein